MINVPKIILLLKQTKLIPLKEISVFKAILKKMNKGQPISFKHKQIYNDKYKTNHIRDFLHVFDAVKAIELIMNIGQKN